MKLTMHKHFWKSGNTLDLNLGVDFRKIHELHTLLCVLVFINILPECSIFFFNSPLGYCEAKVPKLGGPTWRVMRTLEPRAITPGIPIWVSQEADRESGIFRQWTKETLIKE